MSNFKNSPYGKRLRATQPDAEEEEPARTRPRINPIFGVNNLSTPSLDSHSTDESVGPPSPELRPRDYCDRFVPSRERGDYRTSYNLRDEGGPSTPSKTKKIIPTESDALRELTPEDARPESPVRANTEDPATPVLPTTPSRKRIFNFSTPSRSNRSNPTTPSRRLDAPNSEAYSLSPVRAESQRLLSSPKRQVRSVCKTPYRVLDAPDLQDDFYVNLVDWSSTNILAVGLAHSAYLWTAHTAAVRKLCDLSAEHDTICSLSWVQKGSILAVGTLHGRLHIYDGNTLQLLRSYNQAHRQRIGSLAWNSYVLTSGSRDRSVHHRDVREPTVKPFRKAAGHKQEVCGIKWSQGDGVQNAYLATGGNDNKVCIWDLRGSRRQAGLPSTMYANAGSSSSSNLNLNLSAGSGGLAGIPSSILGGSNISNNNNNLFSLPSSNSSSFEVSAGPYTDTEVPPGSVAEDDTGDQPLYKFHEHKAAVKALAWDPHVSGVLATGGGTQDMTIRFWNVLKGNLLSTVDTGSQVCNLTWSTNSHELVSTHGYSSLSAQNQICIWKYPSMDMVASLQGHSHRVLYLAMSPDGETIVTGAGDETLRFWAAFPKKEDGSLRMKRESKLDFGWQIR